MAKIEASASMSVVRMIKVEETPTPVCSRAFLKESNLIVITKYKYGYYLPVIASVS